MVGKCSRIFLRRFLGALTCLKDGHEGKGSRPGLNAALVTVEVVCRVNDEDQDLKQARNVVRAPFGLQSTERNIGRARPGSSPVRPTRVAVPEGRWDDGHQKSVSEVRSK